MAQAGQSGNTWSTARRPRTMKAKTYKIGDLVQWTRTPFNGPRKKGLIVAIREDLRHHVTPDGKIDLVYDIQWFGDDQIDRMIDIWIEPLTTEAQKSEA
jgi:hypothetical protein